MTPLWNVSPITSWYVWYCVLFWTVTKACVNIFSHLFGGGQFLGKNHFVLPSLNFFTSDTSAMIITFLSKTQNRCLFRWKNCWFWFHYTNCQYLHATILILFLDEVGSKLSDHSNKSIFNCHHYCHPFPMDLEISYIIVFLFFH